MQQKIQQFIILCERVLAETGELEQRKSWEELRNCSTQLVSHMIQLSKNFDCKHALLFLLSCGNEGQHKNGCISSLFRRILSSIPKEELFNLLYSINPAELNTYILPFLYERGNIGSIATFVSARLGLKVKNESFEFFLNSREWSQEDLLNLSLLALPEEIDNLKANLINLYNSNKSETVANFLNILNQSSVTNPIIPNIKKETKFGIQSKNQNNTNANLVNNQSTNSNQNLKNSLITNKQSNNLANNDSAKSSEIDKSKNPTIKGVDNTTKINSNTPSNNSSEAISQKKILPTNAKTVNNSNSNTTVKTSNSKANYLDNIKEKISSLDGFSLNLSGINFPFEKIVNFIKKPQVIVGIVVLLLVTLYIITSLLSEVDDGSVSISKAPIEAKVPKYWVDAITNKKLTPQYMQADVDYRMGELYLSRNQYKEAVIFFQMALKTEPEHNIAKMRWGYAEYKLGNYLSAEKLLKEALKSEPRLQNANLYLARTYGEENKIDNAIKCYKAEYKNYSSLEVGMEYANYLAEIGKQNDAMDLLAKLQYKYPNKMLILDTKSNKKVINKKNSKIKKTKG